MEPNQLISELQNCKHDIIVFRKLINFASSSKQSFNDEDLKQWKPIFIYIIEAFIPQVETGGERTLLAAHTFFALLSMQSSMIFLKDTLKSFLNCNSNKLCFLDKKYDTAKPELFKLICAHGYLRVNRKEMYSDDMCVLIFDLIYGHCIKYTKHSYFACKILFTWLQKTMMTRFWSTCDIEIEKKLETIIFSNWSNAINEISKHNCVYIFNMYLQIMKKKYNGYLEYLFKHCVDTISWQNEVKYDILAGICEVCNNVKIMTSHDFLLSLCTSLTKYNLQSAGTKVYIAITKKLSEDEWKETFGNVINYLFHHWEATGNTTALQLLCKNWLEPIVKKYKNILTYLWDLTEDISQHYLRSHLQKMASEIHIDLLQQVKIECYINHKDENVRLNGFAICCFQVNNLYNKNRDQFSTIRNFLWYNANSRTVYMRDGIAKYFKVFYANILKLCETKPDSVEDVHYISNWLHEFLLDCFEIGSCYQRRILGLNLYRAILSFNNANAFNKSNSIENTTCTSLLQKHLKATGNWRFKDKKLLFTLLRLVLDSTLDVKQLATSIILDHFDKTYLTDQEIFIVYRTALNNCNSSKFYEAESGAALMSILANWIPLNILQNTLNEHNNLTTYSEFLLNEATSQLTSIKEDILKAIIQNKPFYGVMTALLTIAFENGPENDHLTLKFIEKTLCLLKEATNFFLFVLSSKSENREYSSSFAEMGLAIDETIKNSEVENVNIDELNLTPAHQVLLSCIWMSLKISCELAYKIGTLMHSEATVKDSANIIVTVLLRCRHKGVVEAAGTSIGHLTRSLCQDSKYCELSKMHILHILQDDSMNSLNITRRGAGLSIMFHKIVASDSRRDRPLLHFAVQKLLDLLDDSSDVCLKNVESQHDSPWARRLHFLRTLVADKKMHAQLMPYMEKISLTCFRYLEIEIWTIRNASLQLFGAIVPRLVGQSYGDDLDFGNGYSINHFITHYPILANYVMKELENFSSAFMNFSSELYLHSNIVHILILLSKFSSSGSNLIDYSSQEYVSKARRLLCTLLKNPVLYIRLLAAKAYAALTNSLNIESEIKRLQYGISKVQSINLTHGYLLTIKHLKEKFSVESENINLSSTIVQFSNHEIEHSVELLRFREILQTWCNMCKGESTSKVCYMLETLFLQLWECVSEKMSVTDIFCFDQEESVLSIEKIQPGFYQFIECATKLYANHVTYRNSVDTQIVHKILNSHCVDLSTAFLNHLRDCVPVLIIVLERLLSNEHKYNELLLNAMINYILRSLEHSSLSTMDKLCIKKLIKNVSVKTEDITRSNLSRLKSILIVMFSENDRLINKILSCTFNLSVNEEEHKRHIAVQLMKFAIDRFAELTSTNKLIVLYCCLILLKDEVAEIRETVAESVRIHLLRTFEWTTLEHDECMYQRLLDEILSDRSKLFSNKDTNLFFIKLYTYYIKNNDINTTIENPFYHDDNTHYKEESKFLNLCFYNIHSRKYNSSKSTSENNILEKIEARYKLQEKCHFDHTNLEIVLNTKYVDYLLRKQRIVIQEYS